MAKYDPVTGKDEVEDDSGLVWWFVVPVGLILLALLLDGAR